MESLFDYWGLQKKHQLSQSLTKKQIKEQGILSSADWKYLDERLLRLRLEYVLTPTLINIQPYAKEGKHYEGILYLRAIIKPVKNPEKISKLIHSLFPNPLVLVLMTETDYWISTGQKTQGALERHDISLSQALGNWEIPLTESLRLSKLPHTHFYEFYQSIAGKIFNSHHMKLISGLDEIYNQEGQRKLETKLLLIKEKEAELQKISKLAKSSNQMADKIKWNQKAHGLKQEIRELKENLE